MQNKKLFIALVLGLGAAGCGGRIIKKLEAKEQEKGQFNLPSSGDTGAPLDLVGTNESVTYGGKFLLWADGVTPEQIAAIAEGSLNARRVKDEYTRYIKDQLEPAEVAILAKKSDIESNDAAIVASVNAKQDTPEAYALKEELTSKWFEGSLQRLREAEYLSEAGAAEASERFKGFCEAKLYQFAVSRLVRFSYTQRPRPLQMCEAYYAERGMFTGSSCAPNAYGANYFKCVWGEGVFKTQTFAALEADGGTPANIGKKRAALYRNWLENGLLETVLKDDEIKGQFSYSKLFGDAVLSGKATGLIGFTTPQNAPKYPDIKNNRDVVIRKDVVATPAWKAMAIDQLRLIGEWDSTLGAGDAPFPLFVKENGEASEAVSAREGIVSALRLYAERRDAKVAINGQEVVVGYSYNDDLFNKPVGLSISVDAKNLEAAGKDPELKKLADVRKLLEPADLVDLRAVLAAELSGLETALETVKRDSVPLDKKLETVNLSSIASVTSPGAVVLSRGLSLKIATSGETAAVTLGLGSSGHKSRGCVDLGDGGAFACAEPNVEGERSLSLLSYERAAGKLLLHLAIDDVDALGLGSVPRISGSPDFNDLQPDQLVGRTLEIEVYANRLSPSYQFITGNVRLKAPGGVLEREGSFSADNF